MTYLIQADGKLPNLALMRLSTYLQQQGEAVTFLRGPRQRQLFDVPGGTVYGSSIFQFSGPARAKWDFYWGPILWGGTGISNRSNLREIADIVWEDVKPDYSFRPDFPFSLGFTQRGCRLSCKFCVVPEKEGKPKAVASIQDIWRGDPYPRKIVLLDNDFFGQPEYEWKHRIEEIQIGKFKVSFSQGINIRQINDDSAAALASIEYRDNEFQHRILYTAWDNIGDEQPFKTGVELLRKAGVPPKHLRVYMLIGYAKNETFEQIQYRFNEMVNLGCEPYPMVYDHTNKYLKAFQRWAITGLYRAVKWEDYNDPRKAERV